MVSTTRISFMGGAVLLQQNHLSARQADAFCLIVCLGNSEELSPMLVAEIWWSGGGSS
jgi:hypothetical protein